MLNIVAKTVRKIKATTKGSHHSQVDAEPVAPVQSALFLQSSGCIICWDLDPYQSSTRELSTDSWVSKEYNIDSEPPAGEIEINDVATLLAAADRGCIYCMVIRDALNATYPGWRTGTPQSLRIFVARRLPVIVQLIFGRSAHSLITPGDLQAMGFVMSPEHRGMQSSMTITEHKKKPLEIEIYRREHGGEGKGKGKKGNGEGGSKGNQEGGGGAEEYRSSQQGRIRIMPAEAGLAAVAARFGYATERPSHAADESCFSFIENHLRGCADIKGYQHTCASAPSEPLLPDRVLWIQAPTSSRIQLVEPSNTHAQYIALSYCWSHQKNKTMFKNKNKAACLTEPANLRSRMAGIAFEELPPLFQDVVNIARRLSIDYLWIDRLCIIQGPDGDFKTQAPKMGEIYSNATLTIMAASADSEVDQILTPRDPMWNSSRFDPKCAFEFGLADLGIFYRRRCIPLGVEDQGGDYGKISSRAWTWQERLLSSRSVFYTPSALKFECRCMSDWEGGHSSYNGYSWSGQTDALLTPDLHLDWAGLVEEFMDRDITYASDRLPAIEAVMKRIAGNTGWTPIYGMWREKIVEMLGWKAERDQLASIRPNAGDYAPSWSWASIDGPITYRTMCSKSNNPFYEADPFKYCLDFVDINANQLVLEGYMVKASIRTCQPDKVIRGQPTYEVGSVITDEWITFVADLPLTPCTGNLQGSKTTSTRRLLFGESSPSRKWSSFCFCLLLGKSSNRCETLVLGLRPGKIESLERLGIISGWNPQAYSLSPKIKFTIE